MEGYRLVSDRNRTKMYIRFYFYLVQAHVTKKYKYTVNTTPFLKSNVVINAKQARKKSTKYEINQPKVRFALLLLSKYITFLCFFFLILTI